MEKPFGDPYNIEGDSIYKFQYKAKSQTFSFRTLPYTQLAN